MKFATRRINEWLIVILCVVGITFVMGFFDNKYDLIPLDIGMAFNPHVSNPIVNANVVNAIKIFGGEEILPYAFDWRMMSMVVGVFTYLILGPYLLYRGFIKSKESEERAKPWYWFVGAMLCILSFLVVPTEIIQIKVHYNTLKSADQSRAMDQMRAEANDVGFAIAQYEILEDGLNEEFSFTHLNLDLRFDYEIESISSDTMITFTVQDPEYEKNALAMEVYPYKEKLLKQQTLRFRN